MSVRRKRGKIIQMKLIFLGIAISILLTATTFIGCERADTITEENSFYKGDTITEAPPFYLPGVIEPGNLNDLTLTIYYRDFFRFTQTPVKLEQLIGGWYDNQGNLIGGWYHYKTVIAGRDLIEHRDLINQLFATDLKPTETESTVHACLYYVFEHREYGEIFSVVAWGLGNASVFVNGIEVEHQNIFYEVVLPFLPENYAADMSKFVGL